MITARIQINYKTENNRLIQTIQILPQKKRHIKYFLNNKYQAGRILERVLQDYYVGNGESIIFKKEEDYKNIRKIEYSIEDKIKPKFDDIELTIFSEVPQSEGCLGCKYFREKYKRCLFYQKMNIKIKKRCVDFVQK